MAVYQIDRKTATVQKREDGWYAIDKYGVYDGPYKSAIDAWNCLINISRSEEITEDEAQQMESKNE